MELPHQFIVIFCLIDMPHQMIEDEGWEYALLKDHLNIILMSSNFNVLCDLIQSHYNQNVICISENCIVNKLS